MMLKLGTVFLTHKYSRSINYFHQKTLCQIQIFWGRWGSNLSFYRFRGGAHFILENSVIVVEVVAAVLSSRY